MARKGENIYKRKDGRWEGRYIKYHTSDHKAVYGYLYGKTYSDVKKRLLYTKSHIEEITAINQNEKNTFHYVANLWLINKSNNAKPSTVNHYTNLLTNHIIPYIGQNLISGITTISLQEYVKYLSENGRIDNKGGLSSKTISDIICVIKSILYFSESIGYNHKCSLRYISCKTEKKRYVY